MNLFRKSRGISCQDKKTVANHRQVWRTEKWDLLLERKGRNWGGLWRFFIGCRWRAACCCWGLQAGVSHMHESSSFRASQLHCKWAFLYFHTAEKDQGPYRSCNSSQCFCYLHYYYCCCYYYSLYIVWFLTFIFHSVAKFP